MCARLYICKRKRERWYSGEQRRRWHSYGEIHVILDICRFVECVLMTIIMWQRGGKKLRQWNAPVLVLVIPLNSQLTLTWNSEMSKKFFFSWLNFSLLLLFATWKSRGKKVYGNWNSTCDDNFFFFFIVFQVVMRYFEHRAKFKLKVFPLPALSLSLPVINMLRGCNCTLPTSFHKVSSLQFQRWRMQILNNLEPATRRCKLFHSSFFLPFWYATLTSVHVVCAVLKFLLKKEEKTCKMLIMLCFSVSNNKVFLFHLNSVVSPWLFENFTGRIDTRETDVEQRGDDLSVYSLIMRLSLNFFQKNFQQRFMLE